MSDNKYYFVMLIIKNGEFKLHLKLEDVKEEDRGKLAPCGILCIGCDTYVGESIEAAKKLVEIWESWNMKDTGPMLGLDLEGIEVTLKTLKTFIKSGKRGPCPGCYIGGVAAQICGIAKCVKSKGFWTCAECEDYDPDSETPCPHDEQSPIPVGNKKNMMKMMCARYSRNTTENLKRCLEIGYDAFLKEAEEKVANGWRTWQIISDEMIFTNSMKR